MEGCDITKVKRRPNLNLMKLPSLILLFEQYLQCNEFCACVRIIYSLNSVQQGAHSSMRNVLKFLYSHHMEVCPWHHDASIHGTHRRRPYYAQ